MIETRPMHPDAPRVTCAVVVLFVVLASMLRPRAAQAQPSATTESSAAVAQARYARGLAMFQAGDLHGAEVEFRASLAAYNSPNTRLMLGRALAGLDRRAEALVEFERSAADARALEANAPQYTPTREAAELEASRVRPSVGRVVFAVTPADAHAVVHIGPRTLPTEALDVAIPFDPGTLTARFEAQGYRAEQRSVIVQPGIETRVEIALTPLPVASSAPPAAPAPVRRTEAPNRGLLALGATAGGLAIVGAALTVTFGILAQSRYDALQHTCNTGTCPSANDPVALEGQSFQTAANAALWPSIGFGALAIGLFVAAVAVRHPERTVAVIPLTNGIAIVMPF